MRSLPTEQNPELVAMVITSTLESLDMKVADIIEDARSRQMDLEARIAASRPRTARSRREIELGVDEIVKLEASLAETMSVKERLEQAHQAHPPLEARGAAADPLPLADPASGRPEQPARNLARAESVHGAMSPQMSSHTPSRPITL